MCIRQIVLYEKGYRMNTVTVTQLASSSLLLPEEVVSMQVSFVSSQCGQVWRGGARNDNPGLEACMATVQSESRCPAGSGISATQHCHCVVTRSWPNSSSMVLSTLSPIESLPQTALAQIRQELGRPHLTVGQVAGYLHTNTSGQKRLDNTELIRKDIYLVNSGLSHCCFLPIWVEPARKGKGQKIGNFTLYVLGSLDYLYIFFCFAGNCHVFEAYRGKSYYGI